MAIHQYFPKEFIALQHEMLHHPDVSDWMNKCNSQYMEDRLAHLCTHLGMEIDGYFDADELSAIAQKITDELYRRRTGVVITHAAYQD